MKPGRRWLAALLVMLLLAGGGLAAAWLVTTTAGARWLIETLPRQAGLTMTVARVEGRLSDRLALYGVRIERPRQTLCIARLVLDWKPLLLLSGTVGIRDLLLEGVRLDDASPPRSSPPALAWPRPPRAATLVDLLVDRLQISDFRYRTLSSGATVTIGDLSGTAAWQGGRMTLDRLNAVSAAGQVSGRLSAGFERPSLEGNLQFTPTTGSEGGGALRRATLTVALKPGGGERLLAGPIALQLSGTAGGAEQQLEVKADLGLLRQRLYLRDLHLKRPGRRGELAGQADLDLSGAALRASLQVAASRLDLAPFLSTDLSGSLSLTGTVDQYRGHLRLDNRGAGWRAIRLGGRFRGNRTGLSLELQEGSLLEGTLRGHLETGWSRGLSLAGTLQGRGMNPARLAPDWKGTLNLDLQGDLRRRGGAPVAGTLQATLLESRLHGQPLTGELRAETAGKDLRIGRLKLQGKGFDLAGQGDLRTRVHLAARITDLSRLLPQATGRLQADGWVGRRGARWIGRLQAEGGELAAAGAAVSQLRLEAGGGDGPDSPLLLSARLQGLAYRNIRVAAAALSGSGTLDAHRLEIRLQAPEGEARVELAGGVHDREWRGRVEQLSGRDRIGPWYLEQPARLVVGPEELQLAPLRIAGGTGEELRLSARLGRHPENAVLRAAWQAINLDRVAIWLEGVRVTGDSSGRLDLDTAPSGALSVRASIRMAGTVRTGQHALVVRQGELDLEGGQPGLRGELTLQLEGQSRVAARFRSREPARLALPARGDLALEASLPDLALLQPLLPAQIRLAGGFSARASGRLMPGQRLELAGTAALTRASLAWQRREGEIRLGLRDAGLDFSWRGEALNARCSLTLAEFGQARGEFHLPLPARLPVRIDPQGPLQGSLKGQLRESGVLAALFPGLVQESRGEITSDLKVSGTWAAPRLGGLLRLSGAGAYLPSAGIRLSDVELSARLERDTVQIESLRAVSGNGHLRARAQLRLAGWQVAAFSGSVIGDRFLTVNFPELELESTPRLSFEGTPGRLQVRGELLLPLVRITGTPFQAAIAPSRDVVREGPAPPVPREGPLALDARVHLTLGDRVLVKTAGIDAQLGGELDLNLQSLDRITSSGQIRVTKGRYQTYGVTLDIERGRLFYAGGPVTHPTVDILALRRVEEVRAGVTVSGSLQAPVTRLYSEPPMPDVDILAYIVLGHPLGSGSGEQAGLLAKAAGALLSAGQSASLQDQIKQRLGLSTLEIESAPGQGGGHMGYKPLAATPPGAAPASQPSGISQTMVTVGKFLTPQLYISYGRSLFTGGNLFRLRYDISRRWQIETQTGQESGVDLYYKIDFQ